MAGMLPGVETARRRRLRSSSVIASGFGIGSTRTRSRVSHDNTHFTDTFFLQRNQSDEDDDDKLGGAAKEAKQRLNGRLRGHFKSQITRQNSQERVGVWRRSNPTTSMVMENLQMEVFGYKKSGSKRFSWGKIGSSWKSSNQDECAICLDRFKASEMVTHLPCAHRFHSDCVFPWLESNAQCPCCRTTVFSYN